MTSSAVGGRLFAATLLAVLLGSNPGWTQEPAAPPDTAGRLGEVVEELDSGERVRLHLPGTEPVAATVLDAAPDSLHVRGDAREARVATSRIERLEVARHPYGRGASIGAAGGAVVGGVLAALSADWDVEQAHTGPGAPARAALPLIEVTAGVVGGALAGGGLGTLIAAGITDWEQRYPPR